eukprot:797293-Prorocentrum_minimum.AAC.1
MGRVGEGHIPHIGQSPRSSGRASPGGTYPPLTRPQREPLNFWTLCRRLLVDFIDGLLDLLGLLDTL